MKRFIGILIGISFLLAVPLLAQRKKKNKDKQQTTEMLPENQARSHEDPKADERQTSLLAERSLLEGLKYDALDNYGVAIENFQKALRINPKSSGIHYQIANTYLKAKKVNEAIPYAQKAIDLESDNRYYYLLLAKLYETQGQYNEAAKVYENLFAKKIAGSDLYTYDLAQVYQFRANEPEKALKWYNYLEKKYGLQEALSKAKQLVYLGQKNTTEASREAEKLANFYPDNIDFQLNYAETLLANFQDSKAESFLKTLQAKDLTFASHLLLLQIYQKNKKNNEANTLTQELLSNKNLPEEARRIVLQGNTMQESTQLNQEWEKAIEKNPQDAETWWLYAKNAEKNKEFEKARKAYYQVVSIDANRFQAWQSLLYLDSQLFERQELLKHAEQALELYPSQAIIWLYNGVAYHESKQYEQALESYKQGLRLAKNNEKMQIQFRIREADALNYLKKYKESDQIFEEILAQNPSNLIALNNYSYYLAQRNQKLDIAFKNSRKLLDAEPENNIFLATHARILYRQNKWVEAQRFFEKSLLIDSNAKILEQYGDTLFKLNQREKALEQWQKARSMKGGSELLEKKIASKQLSE